MSKEIPLTRGYVAIVDDIAHEFLSQWLWSAVGTDGGLIYAVRGVKMGPKQSLHVSMHRHVLGVPEGKWFVDHINHDTLDNRRGNLRLATSHQNAQNRRSHRNKSGFRGVYRDGGQSYFVTIQVRGMRHVIGRFADAVEAAKAYDAAAKRLHGKFAVLNFLD